MDAPAGVEVVRGDALSGDGLQDALEGIEVAYYLIHSMEPAGPASFVERDRAAARRFAAAAAAAGVGRIVYLGGLLPPRGARSAHLASRAEVERILRDAVPASVCAARVDRDRRALAVVPRDRAPHRAAAGDAAAARGGASARSRSTSATPSPTSPRRRPRAAIAGESLDIAGPEVLSYGAMIERIAALLLRPRATTPLPSAFGALGRRARRSHQRHAQRAARPADGRPRTATCSPTTRAPASSCACDCTASTRRSSTRFASGRRLDPGRAR